MDARPRPRRPTATRARLAVRSLSLTSPPPPLAAAACHWRLPLARHGTPCSPGGSVGASARPWSRRRGSPGVSPVLSQRKTAPIASDRSSHACVPWASKPPPARLLPPLRPQPLLAFGGREAVGERLAHGSARTPYIRSDQGSDIPFHRSHVGREPAGGDGSSPARKPGASLPTLR